MERTERLGLVLSPLEKKVVVRLAEAEGGLSQAALVRRLIREAAKSRDLWPPADQPAADAPAQAAGQEVAHGD